MDKIRINIYQVLTTISSAVDLITPELTNHHQQVAYLSYRIAEQLKWSKEEQKKIFMAGLLHDMGALSSAEKLSLIESEPITANSHAFRGAKLLSELYYLSEFSETIRYHHVKWDQGKGKFFEGNPVPTASNILYLADRTCVLIKRNQNILSQAPQIMSDIHSKKESHFAPDLVDALEKLSIKEHIWLELVSQSPADYIAANNTFEIYDFKLNELIAISKIFSHVIDFRSRFTATHSAGVANTARKLAELANFSENECKMMLIAGYLHDLGKLGVDNAILEKNGALTKEEFDIMRRHTFDTYTLLNKIEGLETINKWASFHHERLNGTGYPFHLKAESIPLGSRVMAVADVFTALIEDRPYRPSMPKEKILNVLNSMVENGALSQRIVTILEQNFDEIAEVCRSSQMQAVADYDLFYAE